VLLDRAGDAESGDVIQGFADNREIQLVNVDWEEPVVGYVPEGTRSLGLRQGGTEAPHLILERLLERVAASGSRVVLMLCEAEGKARSRILWARARGFAVVVVVAEGRPSAPAADLADAVWSISENRTDELARLLVDLR
jgi:hypothetical protein